MPAVVNGRFFLQTTTGVQRFAREVVFAAQRTSPGFISGSVVPSNVLNAYVPENVPILSRGFFSGHLWEQLELPVQARDNFVLNLCNTAPVMMRDQLVVLHDIAFVATPQNFGLRFRLWYRAMVAGYLKRSAFIATVSEYSADEIARHFNHPRNRIAVVYEGSEHILRAPIDNSIIERFDLHSRPFVLAMCSSALNKNFIGVVKAAEAMHDCDARFVVVGRTASAKVFGRRLLTSGNVLHVGEVSDGQLRALYEAATCFVFPSFYEGFGLPPLEAMAVGCPVVVSNVTSLPEVCGSAALYCDPHDPANISSSIRRILDNPHLRQDLQAAGKEHARKFTWTSTANELLAVVQR